MFGRACAVWLRLAAVALVAPKSLEESNRDKSAGIGQRGVAGLVPVWVIFATDNMEKVAARETQLLGILRGIVVKGPNNLFRKQDVNVLIIEAGKATGPQARPEV